ncbi:hypothetical protein CR513_35648, partial [Mucuna pruriens]
MDEIRVRAEKHVEVEEDQAERVEADNTRLEEAKGRWADELPQVLWSYHTTPHSTIGETPFRLTYGTEAVILVEIGEPSPRMTFFESGGNEEELRANLDLLQEVCEIAHVKEYAVKARAARKYNRRVMPRHFKIADLVLRRMTRRGDCNKLSLLWEGPFKITEEVGKGAYHLEYLDGRKVPHTWNALNKYFRCYNYINEHIPDNGRPKRPVRGYKLHVPDNGWPKRLVRGYELHKRERTTCTR